MQYKRNIDLINYKNYRKVSVWLKMRIKRK